MDELKNYDNKLIYIIIFNIVLTLWISNPSSLIENNLIISTFLTVPILYLPTYLINNLIPSEWKFKLIYPDNEKHRFAYGIFRKLRNGDIQYNKKLIDLELIINTYGLPKTKSEEDNLWYSIYEEHRYDNKISQQHREFLFCRDFTTIILIMTILFPIILSKIGLNADIYINIGLLEFWIFFMLSRYKNKKMVLSVLQEETKSLKDKIYKD